MAVRKPKVTYTYDGITFHTASKQVSKMWKAGNQSGAYRRYLSDTIGRQLRSIDLNKDGVSKLLTHIEKKHTTVEKVRKSVKVYEKHVAENIEQNIKSQYKDLLDQLKDSSTIVVKRLAEKVSEIIESYSYHYMPEMNSKMQQEIRDTIDEVKEDIDENALQEIEIAEASLDIMEAQEDVRSSLRESRLKGRKDNGN